MVGMGDETPHDRPRAEDAAWGSLTHKHTLWGPGALPPKKVEPSRDFMGTEKNPQPAILCQTLSSACENRVMETAEDKDVSEKRREPTVRPVNVQFPDRYEIEWTGMVNRGRLLREKREKGEVIDVPDNDKKIPCTKVKGKIRKDVDIKTPENVRKWILLRHDGMPLHRASQVANCSWGEVRAAYLQSEECRCAMDAFHEDSRHLMKEMAYSSMEEALSGENVTKEQVRVACHVLTSMEREHFGKAESAAVLADGKIVGGGITINLIDVSKGYRPPAAALLGDGEEGVLV